MQVSNRTLLALMSFCKHLLSIATMKTVFFSKDSMRLFQPQQSLSKFLSLSLLWLAEV